MAGSLCIDMSKLGSFGKIAVEAGHAGDTVAVYHAETGQISSGGAWHGKNIFRRLGRSSVEETQNRDTRQAFLDAMGKAIGETDGKEILRKLREELGKDADVLTGFKLGKDGKVKSNTPLTERRISLIVDKLRDHAAANVSLDTEPRASINNQSVRSLFDAAKRADGSFVNRICDPNSESAKNPLYARLMKEGIIGELCMCQLERLQKFVHLDEISNDELRRCGIYTVANSAKELNDFLVKNVQNHIKAALMERAADENLVLIGEDASPMAEALLLECPVDVLRRACVDAFSHSCSEKIMNLKKGMDDLPSTKEELAEAEKSASAGKAKVLSCLSNAIKDKFNECKGKLKNFSTILKDPKGNADWMVKNIPGLAKLASLLKTKGKGVPDLNRLIVAHTSWEEVTWSLASDSDFSAQVPFEATDTKFDERNKEFEAPILNMVRNALSEKGEDVVPPAIGDLVLNDVKAALANHAFPAFFNVFIDEKTGFDEKAIQAAVKDRLEPEIQKSIDSRTAKLADAKRQCEILRQSTQELLAKLENGKDEGLARLVKLDLQHFGEMHQKALNDKKATASAYKAAADCLRAGQYELISKCADELVSTGVLKHVKTFLQQAKAVREKLNLRTQDEEAANLYSLILKSNAAVDKVIAASSRTLGADELTELKGVTFALAVFRESKENQSLWRMLENGKAKPNQEAAGLIDDYTTSRMRDLRGFVSAGLWADADSSGKRVTLAQEFQPFGNMIVAGLYIAATPMDSAG